MKALARGSSCPLYLPIWPSCKITLACAAGRPHISENNMLPPIPRNLTRSASPGRLLLVAASALSLFGSAFAGAHQDTKFSHLGDRVLDVVQRSQLVGHTDASKILHVSVNLQPSDSSALQAYADSVSNPASPNYRKFISPSEIGEKFGQAPATLNKIVAYLKTQGLQIKLVTKDNLHVLADGTVSKVESAFQTTINDFHALDPNEAGRLDYYAYSKEPQLPSEWASAVQHVGGLQNFSVPKARTTITPNQARTLYNTLPEFNSQMYGQGRTVGISNWDGYRLTNVPHWYSNYSLPVPSGGVNSNVSTETIDGGSGTGTPEAEGDLDIQMILGQAPQCSLIIYDGNANDMGEPTDVLTREVNDNTADVISESYGWSLDSATASACHTAHVEMTTEGITYLVAAGDSGTNIGQYPYPDCEPEVLIVGGTAAQVDSQGNRQSEVAWNGGGGGWSTNSASFNTLPSWQRATGCPTNINYRLVPDIAAHSAGNQNLTYNAVYFYYNGSLSTVSGTSDASPMMAGDLAVAEQKYISLGGLPADQNGKQRFGRINDLLYSQNMRPDVWYDITVGSNGQLPNGATSTAAVGWDFCSGLGCINWDAFVSSLSGTPPPNISSITPTSAATGTAPTITVNGTNFVSSSEVQFNGTNLTTTYVSSTQLTAKLTTTNTANGGVYPITVVNPGNITSNSVSFTLNFSVPTFSSVSPNSIPQGSGNTTVSISGYGIYSATTVLVNGTAVSSTYVSARALTAVIPASDLTSVGTLSLKLKNPTPGGGTSSALSITVTASAPAPTISSINPTSGTAGSSFTLTVTGTNFVSGSTIQWNGTGIATTYVSVTQLTGQVTSSNTASAGTYPIAVINPGPQTSNSVNFTVNPALAITSLNPSSAPQGSSLTLTVNGTGFVNGSTVEWNGSSLGTTYVSSTQLTAQVTSGNTANVGTDAVTVVNPDTTTSNSVSFTVSSGLTVTSISPNSALTGGTATMTVTGSGFVSGAVVQFNGASLTTTFVSSTQLTAKVTATNTASTGVFPVTVVNPGGATSNSVNFSVNNPVATISSVTPNTIAVGSGDTTITISGYGLVPTSTVLINGTAVSTTYVSARQLTAVIPASYLATAGSLSVQVKNPAPGGGTTAKTTITVQ